MLLFRQKKPNLTGTTFPIILISNINEIYVDDPHFLIFQIT